MSNIKIQDVDQRVQYTATASQTVFSIPFPFLSNSDIVVYQNATKLDLGTGAGEYGLSGAGSPSGGSATLVTGATVNDIITIYGALPIDRTSIYSATISNLTGSDLNNDFNRDVIMMRQMWTTQNLLQLQYAPYEEVSQDEAVTIDRWLPKLAAGEGWRMNDAGTAFEVYTLPDGGAAGIQATYVTVTANADLTNELSLDTLGDGFMVNNTGSTTITPRSISGTATQTTVANGSGVSGNPTISLADNLTIPGVAGFNPPAGTTAQRSVPGGNNINMRWNTDLNAIEYYDHGSSQWEQLAESLPDGPNTSVQFNNGGALDGSANFTFDGNQVAITGDLQVDNINVNGNAITSTDAAGDISITPHTTGNVILDGVNWPQADGAAGASLQTDGAGQASWVLSGSRASATEDYFNGIFVDRVTLSVASDGATITLTLTANSGTHATMSFSTGLYEYDLTTPATQTLTAGTDAAPLQNYIYMLESNKPTLTVSTSGFPSAEHSPIATVVCQSAASMATDGAYKVHQWLDNIQTDFSQGHSLDLNYWIRNQQATWTSGVALTPTVGVSTFSIATTVGTVLQLHSHPMPAFDTSTGSVVFVPNDSSTAYARVTNLTSILTDAAGDSMSNRRFNLVVWGVVSEDTGDCQLFINLPTDTYGSNQAAIDDTDRTAVYNIPAIFRGTGFLISRLTVRHVNSSSTWSILQNEDLRGIAPSVATGSGTGGITALIDDPNPTLANDLDVAGFGIKDTNGNELLGFTETASAVNSVILANSATGNAVSLTSTGDDASVPFSITTKGNGDLSLTPGGTGSVVLDGINWPQADGTAGQTLITDGAGQMSFARNGFIGVQVFTASGTYTPDSDARIAFVRLVGGGGGSGGAATTTASQVAISAGGGGGGYSEKSVDVSGGAGVTVTIGAGGAGGAAGNNAGSAGGTTSFGAHCSATGGSGGPGGPTVGTTNNGTTSGAGGGSGSGGDVNIDGSSGQRGLVAAGYRISTNFGGNSMLSGIGTGNTGAGAIGKDYGGGATGVGNGTSSATRAGEDGADGIVIVYEYA